MKTKVNKLALIVLFALILAAFSVINSASGKSSDNGMPEFDQCKLDYPVLMNKKFRRFQKTEDILWHPETGRPNKRYKNFISITAYEFEVQYSDTGFIIALNTLTTKTPKMGYLHWTKRRLRRLERITIRFKDDIASFSSLSFLVPSPQAFKIVLDTFLGYDTYNYTKFMCRMIALDRK